MDFIDEPYDLAWMRDQARGKTQSDETVRVPDMETPTREHVGDEHVSMRRGQAACLGVDAGSSQGRKKRGAERIALGVHERCALADDEHALHARGIHPPGRISISAAMGACHATASEAFAFLRPPGPAR